VSIVFSDLFRQVERDRSLTEPALSALDRLRSEWPATEAGLAFWAFTPLLRREGRLLRLIRPDPDGAATMMIAELAEWRSMTLRQELDDKPAPFDRQTLELWREYAREEIPPLFGARFNPGNWNAGIVRLGTDLILLTTLKKGSLSAGNHYDDAFLAPDRMQWQSQNRTRRDDQIGRMLSGADPAARVYLFVRNGKLRSGKAAPFLYCGQPVFEGWEGEKPITVTWRLPAPVPEHLRGSLGVE